MSRILDLSGKWLFRERHSQDWKTGTVPGCVQLDLEKLGELAGYAYRMNELEYHRLEGMEWTYRKSFEWTGDVPENIRLVFEGIDTLADIYMNGSFLGRAENMFIPYDFNVNGILREGANEIEVCFDSPVRTVKAMEKNDPLGLIVCQETARAYARKAQYSYGWDWGPRIVQTGLWKPVYIEAPDTCEICSPYFHTEGISKNKASVRVGAEIETAGKENPGLGPEGRLKGKLKISLDEKVVIDTEVQVCKKGEEAVLEWTGVIEEPALWYPNGMGGQPLYRVEFQVFSGGAIACSREFKAGIRTIRLIQDEDEQGRSFIFEVNGIKVFAKGANWIPADNLLPRVTGEDSRWYVQAAKDSNMNMLRVWGGGIYERPEFYEACDEMGIMVWQDFMYACAQYPDHDRHFRENAEREAVHAVKSLRRHTSIVLWCGNNENSWASDEWWHVGELEYHGNHIYKNIIPSVLNKYDPYRPYWLSTPYGGDAPNSPDEGDRHNWDVWNGWRGYRGYLSDNGRFLSEFGFHSLPAWKTVLSYTDPEDRHALSPVMLSHERNLEGTEKLVKYMVEYLGFPRDFRSLVYLTHFNQAQAVKCGVEHWRTRKFMTSGTLYWQLNDCWPGASWSCVDYYKRKKALYYYTRRMYGNILPVLKYKGGCIEVHVVNDRLFEVKASIKLKAYDLGGGFKGDMSFIATLLPNSAEIVKILEPGDLGIGHKSCIRPIPACGNYYPAEVNSELLDTVIYVVLEVPGEDLCRNCLLFDEFRNLELVKPDIRVAANGKKITLVSDVPAFGLFLEPENDVDLSDNCVDLMPGIPYEISASGQPGNIEVFDLTAMVNKLY